MNVFKSNMLRFETSTSYIDIRNYNLSNIRFWLFRFYSFQHCKGVSVRLFGIELKIIERNATEKLINKWVITK